MTSPLPAFPPGDGIAKDGAATLLVDSRCRLGESILWCDRRRVLYWTDIPAATLWRFDPGRGDSRTWTLPEALGCIALAQDGRLLLGLANGLHAADPETHAGNDALPLAPLAAIDAGDPGTRVNDGRADRDGNFVFGVKGDPARDAAAGRFHQYSAAHGLRTLDLPRAAIPNSICFDAAGTRMYFCDSSAPRILCCRYDAARAAVSDVRVFAELDDRRAEPDGSTVDAEDALWNAQWGGGRVVRYLPDGRVERSVEVPAPQASCCALREDVLCITTAREGLSPAQLAAFPQSGGVFAAGIGRRLGRPESRVSLP